MTRSISVDLLKSLSIFGVVFIHGSFLFGTNSTFQIYTSNLFRFCVPCFIIIWAYLFEKSYQKKTYIERKKYILTKFFHLFTIFFIWSFCYFLYLVDWNTLTLTKIVTSHFSGYGWAGQYFFIILFQLLLLFPILRKLPQFKYIYYLFIILLVLIYIYYGYFYDTLPSVVKKMGDRPFIFWIPYVYIGIALTNNKIKKIRLSNTFFVFLIPLESYFLNLYGLDYDAYITPIILTSSIIFSIALIQNPIKIKSERIGNFVSFIGKNTLTIFVSNPMMILILDSIIPKYILTNIFLVQIILPFLSSLLIICFCLILSILINKSKLNGVLN